MLKFKSPFTYNFLTQIAGFRSYLFLKGAIQNSKKHTEELSGFECSFNSSIGAIKRLEPLVLRVLLRRNGAIKSDVTVEGSDLLKVSIPKRSD